MARKDFDETIIIPPDTTELNEDARIRLLKKINLCETRGEFLDSGVVDQLLSEFRNEKCFVYPAYCSVEGMNPYYGKYISNHKVTNYTERIVLPLCDNSHFYGYIADLCKGNIIFIDSLYKPKSGHDRLWQT